MTFLRLLSQEAYQNFTYTCINAAAWHNQKGDNYNFSIRLLGENEVEFGYNEIKPIILADGCKVSYLKKNFPQLL
mgnify:FL=1